MVIEWQWTAFWNDGFFKAINVLLLLYRWTTQEVNG